MECLIFIGIQASGKTTFYQQKFLFTHVHISLDLLKTRHRQQRFIELCLQTQQRFVIDNTNPTMTERTNYIALAKAHKFAVSAYYFVPDVGRALVYNQQRPTQRCVPDVAIKGTKKSLQEPSFEEGFDQIFYVYHNDTGGFVVQEQIKDAI